MLPICLLYKHIEKTGLTRMVRAITLLAMIRAGFNSLSLLIVLLESSTAAGL